MVYIKIFYDKIYTWYFQNKINTINDNNKNNIPGFNSEQCIEEKHHGGSDCQPDVCRRSAIPGPRDLPQHAVVGTVPDHADLVFPLEDTWPVGARRGGRDGAIDSFQRSHTSAEQEATS